MDNEPLVSIVMPAYNVEKYIAESIESVINQTYRNWELIIVNDCSEDSTVDIINGFNDKRIILISNKNNLGAAISRNIAIQRAKGKYVAFLDGDDLWFPSKLEKQIFFMEENNYLFSYTNYQEMADDGQLRNIYWTGPKIVTKTKLFNYDYIGCLTMIYNREKLGNFEIVDLKKRNDYALKLKIIKKADCYLLGEVLSAYRKRSNNSLSSRELTKFNLLKHYYELYKKSEDMCLLASIFLVARNCFFGILKKIFYKYN